MCDHCTPPMYLSERERQLAEYADAAQDAMEPEYVADDDDGGPPWL